ncbi:TPA: DUF551 domain-containing protein [Serratia marcescens]
MTLTTERQQFAEQNEMSMDFVNWFFDKKKDGCGNAWLIMAAAMWEGWKGRSANREAQPVATVLFSPHGVNVSTIDVALPDGTKLYTAPPAPAVLAQPVSGGYKLADGWIACSERMPKDGDVVLVFQEGGIIFCAEVDDGEFYPDEFPRVPTQGREITHWMPLPTPPEVRRDDA